MDKAPASSEPAGDAPREAAERPLPLLSAGWRSTKRVLILLLGVSVLVVGALMVVLPGPAFLVIPAGLGILATEFLWARRILKRLAAYVPKPRRDEGTPPEPLPSRSSEPPAHAPRAEVGSSLTPRVG